MPPPVVVRPRAEADLPRLAVVLGEQQAASGYPVRWPLPFPVEEFLVRRGELGAWVAERDGLVVGHVALTAPGDGWDAQGWVAGTGAPVDRLAAVSVLFVDPAVRGLGVGRQLLATAVDGVRALGRRPVLDVVQENLAAVALYRRTGWRVVGEARPPWLPDDRAARPAHDPRRRLRRGAGTGPIRATVAPCRQR